MMAYSMCSLTESHSAATLAGLTSCAQFSDVLCDQTLGDEIVSLNVYSLMLC